MDTNGQFRKVHVQPFIDEASSHASGAQIGRYHGAAVITQCFADHDRSQVMQALCQSSADIERYFGALTHSYAVPFIAALSEAFGEAAGDRIAAFAVGLLCDIDPAELAREIAAVRRGIAAGFAAAIEDLNDREARDYQSRPERRTEPVEGSGPVPAQRDSENS